MTSNWNKLNKWVVFILLLGVVGCADNKNKTSADAEDTEINVIHGETDSIRIKAVDSEDPHGPITTDSSFGKDDSSSGDDTIIPIDSASSPDGIDTNVVDDTSEKTDTATSADTDTMPDAQLITYDWPTEAGEAVLSDKYKVTISSGGQRQAVETLISTSIDEENGGPKVFHNRTFSWAMFASDYSGPVTIEVEKLFGTGALRVEVVPSSYDISPVVSSDGKTATFSLVQSQYVAVNFVSDDNKQTADGVIKHMLMIFADPLEENVPMPSDDGVLTLNNTTTQTEVNQANIIYVAPGFYNLRNRFNDGVIQLKKGQTVYLAGGAFVHGKLYSNDGGNVTVRGRGVLSGRPWNWNPGEISALVELNGPDNIVEGIVACDTNQHGIVPGWRATMTNVKLWGWHYNNDGFRPWGGTVTHCFLRPTDDAFYVGGNGIEVNDTVIWQSFNGAVVTCGWGGYDSYDFYMHDSHVIYPEWNAIGNNNGVIASQMEYGAECQNVLIEEVTIDGNICALTNLKPKSSLTDTTFTGDVGGIHDITFRNVTVLGRQLVYNYDRTDQFTSHSVLRGAILNNGTDLFGVYDITFQNVTINGQLLTNNNKSTFFDIDPVTTDSIRFN